MTEPQELMTAHRAAELIAAHSEEVGTPSSDMPLLSVCVVTYNHAKFIREALDGVYMQQTPFPFEVVAGDDRSTDGTTEIVLDYRARFPNQTRVLLAKENLGRYTGNGRLNFVRTLQACRGRYVALLEGDDSWTEPRKLHKQVALLDRYPSWSLVFHPVQYDFDEPGRSPERIPRQAKPISGVEEVLGDHLIQTCSMVLRRAKLPPLPDWYFQLAMGDRPLCLLLAEQGAVGFLDEVMAKYRAHGGGLWWSTAARHKAREELRMYEVFRAHLQGRYDRLVTGQMTRLLAQLSCLSEREGDRDAAARYLSRLVQLLVDRSEETASVVGGFMAELAALPVISPDGDRLVLVSNAQERQIQKLEEENRILRDHLRLFETHPVLGPLLRLRRALAGIDPPNNRREAVANMLRTGVERAVETLRRQRRRPVSPGQGDAAVPVAGGPGVTQRHDASDPLVPILLGDTAGRSGTTLLMVLLGTSPAVAFERVYPFESRYLTYLLHRAMLLKGWIQPSGEWNASTVLERDLSCLRAYPNGRSPLLVTPEGTPPFWLRCFLSTWRNFSEVASETSQLRGDGDTQVPLVYYAEKSPRWCYDQLSSLVPLRGIHLVRDPRDVLLSALAFDRKRGTADWSPEPSESLASFVTRRMPVVRDRLQRVLFFQRAGDPGRDIVVRYEDMVLDLSATAKRIGAWLAIELDADSAIRASSSFLASHATSSGPQASVFRWKRELPEGINSIYVEHLHEELEALGYDLS